MAVTFRAGSNASGNSTSLTVPLPAGLTAGDLVIVAITGGPPTPPSGFTLAASNSGSTSYVYTHVATSSEPSGGWVFTKSGSTFWAAAAVAYSGVDAIDQTSAFVIGTTSTTSPAVPVVTTLYNNETIILIRMSPSTPTAFPTGSVSRQTAGVSGSGTVGIRDLAQTTAGATPSGLTYTSSSGQAWRLLTLTLTANVAPNAPALGSPATGATIDRTVTQRFTWTFSDNDTGDSQSAFDLRYRVGTAAWTTVSGTTPNSFVDIAAGTFPAADYEWQVRTTDSVGNVGPWSSSSFFTAATPAAGPTITSPTSGGTINLTPYPVVWSIPSQTKYQVRVVADTAGSPDTSTVLYDTGSQDDTANTARTVSVPFTTNGSYVHVQVRSYVSGLWTAWADVRVLVSWTAPTTPIEVLTTVDGQPADITVIPRIEVAVTNPAPGTGVPAAAYNDVYRSEDGGATSIRVATGVAPNGTWIDYATASGVDYTYQTVTVGTNGATASSGWSTEATDTYGVGAYGVGAYGG